MALEEWEGHRDLAAAGFTNDVIQNVMDTSFFLSIIPGVLLLYMQVFCGGCADDANMMYGVGDMWIREKEEESGKTRALQLKALCDILQVMYISPMSCEKMLASQFFHLCETKTKSMQYIIQSQSSKCSSVAIV